MKKLLAALVLLTVGCFGQTNRIDVNAQTAFHAATDTGAANVYVVAIHPATAYYSGMPVIFIPANSNTTTSTINVNALGAKTIKKQSGTGLVDVVAGDLQASTFILLIYDGTNFELIGPFGNVTSGSGAFSGVNAQTVSYLALTGDNAKLITMNGTSLTLTLPAAPPSATWAILVENVNATDLTISRNSLNIDGAASNLTLHQNQGVIVFTDGSNYFTSRGKPTLTASDIPNITESQVTSLVSDLALKAPLASPALTGTPTAPTAAGGTNTTQIATTAFATTVANAKAAAGSCGTHSFEIADTTSGPTCAQPAIADLQNIAADSAVVNASGSSAAPSALAIPDCANDNAHALIYSTSSHTITCQAITGSGIGGGAITLQTNTVNNASQIVLNLKNGNGIAITDGGSGNVTIAGPFAWGGDGSDGALTYDGSSTVAGIAPIGASSVLTAATLGTGANIGYTVYTGTFTGGLTDGYRGVSFTISGFVNSANNGTFLCVFSSATTLTLVNASGVGETHAGTATSNGMYVLSRDVFATTLVVNSGVVIKTANYAISAKTSIANNGGIIMNDGGYGGNGSGLSAGAGPRWTSNNSGTSGSFSILVYGSGNTNSPGGAGGNGGSTTGTQGSAGSITSNITNPVIRGGVTGNTGGSGGQGGTGASGAGGATRAGNTGGTASNSNNIPEGRTAWAGAAHAELLSPSNAALHYQGPSGEPAAGSGGGGGGGDGTQQGGAGGGGGGNGGPGGMMWLAAPLIINSGTISSNGGRGGNGAVGATPSLGSTGAGGGGGGGTGGNGGIMWLVYNTLNNSGTISVSGGTHGVGGAAGLPHGTGINNAAAGGDGGDGQAGALLQIPQI